MKQLLVLVVTLIVTSYSFADTQSANNSSSTSLKELSAAWKNQQYMHAKEDKNDITIVYGGEDVSRKTPFYQHSTAV